MTSFNSSDPSLTDHSSWQTYDYEQNGYDYLSEPNENLMCPICRNPFVDPVMCESTDHIFCRLCLIRSLELSSTCPIDRLPLSVSLVQPAPKIIIKLVDELIVACPFKHQFQCAFLSQRYLVHTHTDAHECERAFAKRLPSVPSSTYLTPKHDEPVIQENLRFEWCLGRARLLPALSSNSSIEYSPQDPDSSAQAVSNSLSNPSSHSLAPAADSIACPYQKFGCTFLSSSKSLQDCHLSQQPHTDGAQTPRCIFEPLRAFLDAFIRLEDSNTHLKSELSASKLREANLTKLVKSAQITIRQLWESQPPPPASSLPSSPSSPFRRASDSQLHLGHSRLHYDSNHGSRIRNSDPSTHSPPPAFPYPSALSNPLPPPHLEAEQAWARVRELEEEVGRAHEASWMLKELVRTLTRRIGLLSAVRRDTIGEQVKTEGQSKVLNDGSSPPTPTTVSSTSTSIRTRSTMKL